MNINTYCGQVQMYTNRFRTEKFKIFGPNFGRGATENWIIFGKKYNL